MEDVQKEIDVFFKVYEKDFNDGLAGNINAAATANKFSECFIAVNPSGVNCGKNDSAFLDAILQGYQFYVSIGIRETKIISQTITLLDEFHYVNKVRWQSVYLDKEGIQDEMEFEVIYFLQRLGGRLRVFGYITEDEQAILRERGLIPAE